MFAKKQAMLCASSSFHSTMPKNKEKKFRFLIERACAKYHESFHFSSDKGESFKVMTYNWENK